MRDSLTYFDLNDLKTCLVSNAKLICYLLGLQRHLYTCIELRYVYINVQAKMCHITSREILIGQRMTIQRTVW